MGTHILVKFHQDWLIDACKDCKRKFENKVDRRASEPIQIGIRN